MERHYVDCQCSDFGHTIRFTHDPQDGEVWLEVQLRTYEPWHKRVWNALRYVFHKPVTSGHFDCTVLREEDYDRLRDLFNQSEIAKAGAHARAREQLLRQ